MELKKTIFLAYDTALHIASACGYYKIVEYLASLKNININITDIWFCLFIQLYFVF